MTTHQSASRMSADFEHDDLKMVATYLFGDQWRESVAEALETDRRSLVREIASGKPIRQEIWVTLSEIVETKLDTISREHVSKLELVRRHIKKPAKEVACDVNSGKTQRFQQTRFQSQEPRVATG